MDDSKLPKIGKLKSWQTSEGQRRVAEAARKNPDPRTLKPKKELSPQQKKSIEKVIMASIKRRKPRPNIAQKIFRTMGRVPALTAISTVFGSTPVGDATLYGTYNYKNKLDKGK
tara:strand:+ start:2020 stop:2361 length:342 start_codon:yes stop_codon:yes gene_type:complete